MATHKAVNYKAFQTSNIFSHILFCADTHIHSQYTLSQADATKSCLHESRPKQLTGSFVGHVVIMRNSVLCNCNVFKQWSCSIQYNHGFLLKVSELKYKMSKSNSQHILFFLFLHISCKISLWLKLLKKNTLF